MKYCRVIGCIKEAIEESIYCAKHTTKDKIDLEFDDFVKAKEGIADSEFQYKLIAGNLTLATIHLIEEKKRKRLVRDLICEQRGCDGNVVLSEDPNWRECEKCDYLYTEKRWAP